MNDPVYLQWNVPNWITVVLMAAVGFLIVGAIGSGVRVYRKGVAAAIDASNDD